VFFHEGRNLGVVGNGASYGVETVLLFVLLFEPDEAGGAVVAHLHDVIQGKQPSGEENFVQEEP